MASEELQNQALTVSQALATAKNALESFVVTIEGEVSEFNCKAGYKAVYFSVKDAHATMPCMMWMDKFRMADVPVEIGSLVRMTGRFTLHAAKGRMNFKVFTIRLAGEGELRKLVADLAKRLEVEGLMSPERKRPLPKYIETVGLVTSPRGAVVHDVLRTMRRRFPLAEVKFAGVTVEGKTAPHDMMNAINTVVAAGVEVVLLVRGGGQYEDFMPFNDEGLARFIAQCPVPVVTGIGHEPDTTIADMVADVRASTPTHAAEAVTPRADNLMTGFNNAARRLEAAVSRTLGTYDMPLELISQKPLFREAQALFSGDSLMLDSLSDSLYRSIPQNIRRDEAQLDLLSARLKSLGGSTFAKKDGDLNQLETRLTSLRGTAFDRFRGNLDQCRTRLTSVSGTVFDRFEGGLDQAETRLASRSKTFLNQPQSQYAVLASRLNDLSPLNILCRGYSISYDQKGNAVRSVTQVHPGESLSVTLADGKADCRVESVTKTQRVPVDLD